MRPAWRLGINALVGRRSRTALLVAAVVLSTSLVAAVGCALASLNAGMQQRVQATLGRADLRVRDVAGERLDPAVLEMVSARREVEVAAPRARGSVALRNTQAGKTWTALGIGIEPAREYALLNPAIDQGRRVEGDGEIVLSPDLAELLSASLGTTLDVVRFGEPMRLTVVGIGARSDVDVVRRAEATLTRRALSEIVGSGDRTTEIVAALRPGADASAVAAALQEQTPPSVMVQTTALVTSGIGKAVRANTLGYLIASAIASLTGACIVLTGLTTGVHERQRELAIMRALGARRRTLAGAQLVGGGLIGVTGALVGVPLGIFLAWVMARLYPDKLPAGLVLDFGRLAVAGGGAVLAGLIGAAWPAFEAARTKPLRVMSRRARPATGRGIALAGFIGVLCAAGQVAIVRVPSDESMVLWGHMLLGLPLMLGGYFLIGVALVGMVARVVGPALAWAAGVPRRLLVGSVRASPFRNGFIAGALMLGVAMMTDLWTVGGAVLRDWLGSIQFPDAFVNDWSGLSERDASALAGLDFIAATSPITLFKIDSGAFGITEIRTPPTNFVAFDPDTFFGMTRLAWVAGDEAYARRRLREGGAVIVAKEFLVARRGYKIGDTFVVTNKGVRHEFEVVGAVSSPGLDLVGYAFDLGREYQDVAIGSVFGTRGDLRRVFGSEAVHLIQLSYSRPIGDREASDRIRAAMGRAGVVVGSGREIKEGVLQIGRNSMRIASIVAAAAMLISSLGVASIVLASVDARRFELGVLRAVGAPRWMVGKLILCEVMILVITACLLGTSMGLQASSTAMRLYDLAAGIELRLIPPVGPILVGWAMLGVVTLGVVTPLALRVARARPRELLASTRG